MEVAVDIELNYCFKVMKYANVNNSYILNYTYRISVFGDTKFTIYKFLESFHELYCIQSRTTRCWKPDVDRIGA